MKKFVFTLFMAAILCGCHSNKRHAVEEERETVEIIGADSAEVVDIFAYEGVVPSALGRSDSIDYFIVITQKHDSVNGVYQMTTTYIAANGKDRRTTSSKGRQLAYRGVVPQNRDARVYKLVPDSGANQPMNLWVESDTTVVILDDQMNVPDMPHNYRLKSTMSH